MINDKKLKYFKQQYYYKDTLIKYIGSNTQYDYQNKKEPHIFYQTGYSKITLDDQNGSFYIIHPEELNIKRNIIGTVVNIKLIISPKIKSFWEQLKEKLFIYNIHNETNMNKTDYGINIMSIKTTPDFIKYSLEYIISYIYSRKYKLNNEITMLIPLLIVINNSIKNLFNNSINLYKNVYGNNYGDIYGLIKLCNKIHSFLKNNNYIQDITNISNISDSFKNILLENKRKFLKGETTAYNSIFQNLYNNNKLIDNNQLNEFELKELLKDNVNTINLNEDMLYLEKWCNKYYLNFNIIKNYIKEYNNFKNIIFKFDNELIDETETKRKSITFKWFDNAITNIVLNNNPINPFIHGFSYKIYKKIEGTDYYISLIAPLPNYVYEITNFNRKYETLLKNDYHSNYILALSSDSVNFNIKIVNNVDISFVQKICPIIFIPKHLNINYYKDAVAYLITKYNVNGKLSNKIINNYINTINQIDYDLTNNFDRSLYTKFYKFDSDPLFNKYIISFIK